MLAGAAVVVAGILTFRAAPAPAMRRAGIAAMVVALSATLQLAISLGNVDPVAMLWLAGAVWALARGRSALAGLALGIGLSLKPTMFPLLLLPLAMSQAGATGLALATVLATNLLGMLVVPDAGRFFSSVIPFLYDVQPTVTTNGALAGIAYRHSLGSVAVGALQAIGLAALAAVLCASWTELRESPYRLFGFTAVLVLAGLLIPRYSFIPYGVYLVLAMPLFVMVQTRMEIVMAGAAAYLIAYPELPGISVRWFARLTESRYAIGYILLVCVAVLVVRRTGKSGLATAPVKHGGG